MDYPTHIDAQATAADKSKTKCDPSTFQGKVEFKDVWFRYPSRKEDFVLRGLNLTINPKESVALVGESGCGKSTFVNLLMRFYDVDSGEVLIDDVNIKDYDLHSLRNQISMVMQEPIIFNYSIKENILYGKNGASNDELINAATQSNCMEFIDNKQLITSDDSAQALLKQMEHLKDEVVKEIGQAKYDEEVKIITTVCKRAEEAG